MCMGLSSISMLRCELEGLLLGWWFLMPFLKPKSLSGHVRSRETFRPASIYHTDSEGGSDEVLPAQLGLTEEADQLGSSQVSSRSTMTTTFDATLTLTPDLLAGTTLAARPQEAVEAVRSAIERLRGAAWIDVEWWDVAEARLPIVRKMVLRGDIEDNLASALKQTVEMVAYQALKVAAHNARA